MNLGLETLYWVLTTIPVADSIQNQYSHHGMTMADQMVGMNWDWDGVRRMIRVELGSGHYTILVLAVD